MSTEGEGRGETDGVARESIVKPQEDATHASRLRGTLWLDNMSGRVSPHSGAVDNYNYDNK